MKERTEQIRTLLSQNASLKLVRRCLEDTWKNATDADLHSTDPLPPDQVQHIYQRRADLNEVMSGSGDGYEELLSVLNAGISEAIVIHLIQGRRGSYMVFTNPLITNLFGILTSK